jgi:hypothetical protein
VVTVDPSDEAARHTWRRKTSRINADTSSYARRGTVGIMRRRKRKEIDAHPTAKAQSSDQAPGEEVVQVNDRYKRDAPAPDMTQEEQAQHQTGG